MASLLKKQISLEKRYEEEETTYFNEGENEESGEFTGSGDLNKSLSAISEQNQIASSVLTPLSEDRAKRALYENQHVAEAIANVNKTMNSLDEKATFEGSKVKSLVEMVKTNSYNHGVGDGLITGYLEALLLMGASLSEIQALIIGKFGLTVKQAQSLIDRFYKDKGEPLPEW